VLEWVLSIGIIADLILKKLASSMRTKTQMKKREILLKALECFIKHGVEKTSVQMICESSNTSVGSLYHHFGNKEAIAAAVYIEGMRDIWETTLNYLQNEGDSNGAEQLIKRLVYVNVDWISRHKNWAYYIFQNRSVVHTKEQKKILFDVSVHGYQYLEEQFQKAKYQGEIKALPSQLYVSIIIGPVHDYARHYLSGRYKKSLKAYKEDFANAAWLGVKAN